jgi:hypothetical protein
MLCIQGSTDISNRTGLYIENFFDSGFAAPVDMYESCRGRDYSIPAECRTQDVAIRTSKFLQQLLQAKNIEVSKVNFSVIKRK